MAYRSSGANNDELVTNLRNNSMIFDDEDYIEINELSDAFEVRRHRIDFFARVGANDTALELPVLGLSLGDVRLNFPGNLQ